MRQPLLFEIGTEELPASFVQKALEAMPAIATELLSHARLTHGAMRALGTPRRLTLAIDDLEDAQSDLSELVMGPPKSVGIGADGKPTGAAIGFAKKNGVGPDAIRVETTPKGEYVAVLREEKGKRASDVLPALLTTLATRIPFQKSMRWGPGHVAFGRPVHWIVALHGSEVVKTSFADVAAGRTSRGHRFLSPATFELASASDYEARLKSAHVVVDVAKRRDEMHAALLAGAKAIGGELIEDEMLMGECVSLVEEPHVVAGSFDRSFLDLPEGVIVASMRGHQRYFAVRDPATKKLMPRYLNVVNTALSPETIAKGNDNVLRARLKDARFFVDEDRKIPLASRAKKLDGVVFQHKLGSVGQKMERVAALVARHADDPKLAEQAIEAARLAKLDLVTLIVGEFPELQGEMGRFYALEQGVSPVVADAIRDHYAPRGAGDSVPASVVAALVSVADRADTLVGCFGIGLVPSGSADPFALRRATLGVVRIALEGPIDVHARTTLRHAYAGYPPDKLKKADELLASLDEFFRARLRVLATEGGSSFAVKVPGDVADAALGAWDGESIRDFKARIDAIIELGKLPEYEALAVAFKRAFNIAKDTAPGAIDPKLLEAGPEAELAERFKTVKPQIDALVEARKYTDALLLVARDLRAPIDLFFEKVFVMVDDESVKANRLRLLRSIADTVTRIAHFHLLATR